MKPTFDTVGLEKTKPWEYGVRFVFGGAITAATGFVAHHFGPIAGGLFLAFPAILPASLTLVKLHDGRRQAVDDACGACLGSIGLAAFAVAVRSTAATWPSMLVLAVATLAWLAVSVGAWSLWYGSRRRSRVSPCGSGRRRLA